MKINTTHEHNVPQISQLHNPKINGLNPDAVNRVVKNDSLKKITDYFVKKTINHKLHQTLITQFTYISEDIF